MTDSDLKTLKKDMTAEMRELWGDGWVDSYYEQMAEPFVQIALSYLNQQLRSAIKTLEKEMTNDKR